MMCFFSIILPIICKKNAIWMIFILISLLHSKLKTVLFLIEWINESMNRLINICTHIWSLFHFVSLPSLVSLSEFLLELNQWSATLHSMRETMEKYPHSNLVPILKVPSHQIFSLFLFYMFFPLYSYHCNRNFLRVMQKKLKDSLENWMNWWKCNGDSVSILAKKWVWVNGSFLLFINSDKYSRLLNILWSNSLVTFCHYWESYCFTLHILSSLAELLWKEGTEASTWIETTRRTTEEKENDQNQIQWPMFTTLTYDKWR